MRENGFTWKKERSRRYLTKTMIDTDYIDTQSLFECTPAQTESLQHSLEPAVKGIGLFVNANKATYMYFKEKEGISILRGKPLKLVNQQHHIYQK